MRDCTELVVILDRSGSMTVIKDAMEEVMNGYVDQQKFIPGECNFTLVKFDEKYEVEYLCKPIKEITKRLYLEPRGSTAMLDAIGRTINDVGYRLASMSEHMRPNKVLVIIITDGHENASINYSNESVRNMVRHQRDTYKWEFIFLGANQDAVLSAESIGIGKSHSMNFSSNKSSARGMGAKMISASSAYRSGKDAGEELTSGGILNFVDDQKDEATWKKIQEEVEKKKQEEEQKKKDKTSIS